MSIFKGTLKQRKVTTLALMAFIAAIICLAVSIYMAIKLNSDYDASLSAGYYTNNITAKKFLPDRVLHGYISNLLMNLSCVLFIISAMTIIIRRIVPLKESAGSE
jgi:hypothetical protein